MLDLAGNCCGAGRGAPRFDRLRAECGGQDLPAGARPHAGAVLGARRRRHGPDWSDCPTGRRSWTSNARHYGGFSRRYDPGRRSISCGGDRQRGLRQLPAGQDHEGAGRATGLVRVALALRPHRDEVADLVCWCQPAQPEMFYRNWNGPRIPRRRHGTPSTVRQSVRRRDPSQPGSAIEDGTVRAGDVVMMAGFARRRLRQCNRGALGRTLTMTLRPIRRAACRPLVGFNSVVPQRVRIRLPTWSVAAHRGAGCLCHIPSSCPSSCAG